MKLTGILKIGFGVLFPLSLTPVRAQEAGDRGDSLQGRILIDGQVLGRGEYRNGYYNLRTESASPAWMVGERTRLGLGYERKHLSIRVSAQHTGIWGDTGLDNSSGNSQLSVNEAWARVDLYRGLYAQVGRQEIAFDDERLFGREDWEMGGRSHDALRIGYTFGQHRAQAILSFSQKEARTIGGTFYKGDVPYKNLQLFWYHYDFSDLPLQLSGLFVNQGFEIGKGTVPRTGYMQTMGVWGKYLYQNYYAKAEIYCQTGHDDMQAKVLAYLLSSQVGREDVNWGAEVSLDYVSGSDGKTPKRNRTFNMLYGSAHDFFGTMDYFTSANMPVCGLLDISLSGYYLPPVENLKVNAAFHNFITGSTRKRLHRFMGQELDIEASYRIMDDVTLSAGYSVMFPTSVMVFYKGGSTRCWQDWGWLSLNVSPSFVTSAFKNFRRR